MCRSLASVFRYSNDMENPLAETSEELIHLRNYLRIMNLRFNNEIEFKINVDLACLVALIPRLSLQPIVENAIVHGLRDKRGEKIIEFISCLEQQDIIFTIKDNGIGMDAKTITQQFLSGREDVLSRGSSIGLANIDSRIKLLFGNKYGVILESTLGRGSSVSIRVPFQTEKKHEYS